MKNSTFLVSTFSSLTNRELVEITLSGCKEEESSRREVRKILEIAKQFSVKFTTTLLTDCHQRMRYLISVYTILRRVKYSGSFSQT